MTTKEKANQLFGKYYNRLEHTLSEEYSTQEIFLVKQCTLIAVDLLIDQCERFKLFSQEVYWIDVRRELENF